MHFLHGAAMNSRRTLFRPSAACVATPVFMRAGGAAADPLDPKAAQDRDAIEMRSSRAVDRPALGDRREDVH
jgi:hypothetical protein